MCRAFRRGVFCFVHRVKSFPYLFTTREETALYRACRDVQPRRYVLDAAIVVVVINDDLARLLCEIVYLAADMLRGFAFRFVLRFGCLVGTDCHRHAVFPSQGIVQFVKEGIREPCLRMLYHPAAREKRIRREKRLGHNVVSVIGTRHREPPYVVVVFQDIVHVYTSFSHV